MLIEELKRKEEMDPNKHDGSYELVQETVKVLKNVDIKSVDIEDLNMLYFMTIGTWSSSFEKKKELIERSNLLESDKKYLIDLIHQLEENSKNSKYENITGDFSIGMFGSGFRTFKAFKTRREDAQTVIEMVTKIYDMGNEDEVLEVVDEYLSKKLTGLKSAVASLSQILHCLKPYIFPILNKGQGSGIEGYRQLGVELIYPDKTDYFIENVKRIREFRNQNFSFKNYRIIDTFLWKSANLYKEDNERKGIMVAEDSDKNYWWLNANPKIWGYSDIDIGGKHNYKLYNVNGNKRRIFRNFEEVKKGDHIIGYESGASKKIVALLDITKESNGEQIWFEKKENLISPIDY